MANNELNLHIAARTAMMHVAVVLTNLGDARNSTLSSEDMALIQARLADLNRAFIETGLLAAPARGGLSDALRSAGAAMANVMFNMAQKTGYTLTSDDTALFDKLRKEWDSAVRGQQCGVSDAADAARYRWLLNNYAIGDGYDALDSALNYGEPEKMTAAIDAAIQAQAGDAPKGGAA